MPPSRTALSPLFAGICLLALAAPLLAADPLADCQTALSGDDSDAKRSALQILADSPLPDAQVLPVLVAAVGDRQAADAAIRALRQRTQLEPAVYFGQSHYPGYPANDHAESWREWLQEWQADHARQAEIDQALSESRRALAAADQAAQEAGSARRERPAVQAQAGAQ